MKNKSSDNTVKVQFFNQTTIDALEKSINQVIYALDAGRIKPLEAEALLNTAGRDLHKMFWRLTSKISQAKFFTRNWAFYGEQVGHAPGVYLNTNSPAAAALVHKFEDCRGGVITVSAFRRSAEDLRAALKGEIYSVLHSINDMLRRVTKSTKFEVLPLDLSQPLDYNYANDDIAIDEMRVTPVDRFGFSVANPSDAADNQYVKEHLTTN